MNRMEQLIEKIKSEADKDRLGMILCHNGVVRGTSRLGHKVRHLDVTKNEGAWNRILAEARNLPGIEGVEAHLFTGRREVGEDLMMVVVGGDIRENVFPALEETVDRLKREGVSKREWLRE